MTSKKDKALKSPLQAAYAAVEEIGTSGYVLVPEALTEAMLRTACQQTGFAAHDIKTLWTILLEANAAESDADAG